LEGIFLFFIIVIPVLLVSFGYVLYDFYIKGNKKQDIIQALIADNLKILDKDKGEEISFDKQNWLRTKLNYGGFTHFSAEYIFVLISVGFGVLASVLVYFVIQSPITLVVCFFLFGAFPYIVLLKIISLRQEEFNQALKELIDKITSMMRSGLGFEQCFRRAVVAVRSDFAKRIFNMYLSEKEVIGEAKAFEKMFILVDSRELRIFYLTIIIGKQSGGKFSNTLDTLRKTLQDQGELKKEIISSTKEIKVGTYMILALTAFTYMMMNQVFGGALNDHFFYSQEGKIQMFFIILWILFGVFVNNMLTKVK
jgi:tight adherence protein B